MGRLARALCAGFTLVLSFSAQAAPACIWFADDKDVFQVSADTHQITQTIRLGGLDNGRVETTLARAGK